MVGLGEPRVVRAGVVGGSYFDVMGLRAGARPPARTADDGPKAAGAAVLTYRFWTTTLQSDPSVHRQDRPARRPLGDDRRRARAVGAVSGGDRDHRQRRHQPAPSVRDDGDGRVHRMTELFGRLAPGRRPRRRARRAARRARRDSSRSIPRRIRRRPTSASTPCGCAIRSSRRRGPCCWCCSRRRRWSSSSRARTSRT